MPKVKRKPTLRQVKAGVEYVDEKIEVTGERILELEALVLGLVEVMKKQSTRLAELEESQRRHRWYDHTAPRGL